MNKEEGERLAALGFTEKIELLERLRDRSLAFAEARKKLVQKEKNRKGERSVDSVSEPS